MRNVETSETGTKTDSGRFEGLVITGQPDPPEIGKILQRPKVKNKGFGVFSSKRRTIRFQNAAILNRNVSWEIGDKLFGV
ncbi:hypothetical protein TNCV_2202121 [Trichonephila clavipes]|uniref:Uncharacterized protein n=1 Tax=Trichonephila clavipes TaxID=2585209 RepID=A0A8X6RFA7_TRICX|nr:hypothetical protein TNCV_2202121 [Trichonephila clavipes]